MSDTQPVNTTDPTWPADRARLSRLKRAIRRRGSKEQRQARRTRYEEAVVESARVYARRREQVPQVPFENDLPVLEWREPLAKAIAENQVVVVCGETGSGKSTQLPKICLAAGRGVDGFIGHTQPRRIAARSVASRIADELGSPLGDHVGYKVRFQDETSPETYIKLMTDGVLLAEAQSEKDFERYDTLIIDEAHERSLNIDLLLGLLRRVIDRRPDFRLIITSATIDADRFAAFFETESTPAPIIEVSGRSFPVEIRYRPAESTDTDDAADTSRRVADAVDELLAERLSDTLVFLPTERDIRETSRLLRGRLADRQVDIVPLYARLSSKEQQKVFQRGKNRRVVLATNVAESSLTVPGIYSVVDTGTARISRFAAKSRVQRLPIEAVSQASANQRAGRCGRLGPGVCVRLYSEDDFKARPPYTVPEIRRTNLAGAMLRLLTLRLGDLEAMPLLDRPRPDALREAKRTLRELQAIDDSGNVTSLGERIGRMPVDPRVGRMIVAGDEEGCLAEVLIIAAALETQDPRERPVERQEAADTSHKRFADHRSDFLGYLKLWDHLRQMRSDLSGSRFRKECVKQFLSIPKVLEWEDVHRQLLAMTRQQGLKVRQRKEGDRYAPIHRALLTGLLSGVALHREETGYRCTSGEGFQLWPGSALRGTKPKWVVAAEVVETSGRYLRSVARIRPEWLPQLADHLAKRHYQNVRWSLKQQTVLAQEKLTLFELPLAGSKMVPYGKINPEAAREVFLQEALVDEGLRGGWDFLVHNRQAVEQLRQLDARLRGNLGETEDLLDFYQESVPPDVCDARGLRRWLRGTGDPRGDRLRLQLPEKEESLSHYDPKDFPSHLETPVGSLPLQYANTPGVRGDGVTLVVPADLALRIDPNQIDWAIPGLLKERVIGLIRLLPKPLRTRLVPAPDAAEKICKEIVFGQGSFRKTLADALSRRAATPIDQSDLRLDQLPDPLRINLRVEDEAGDCVIESRDFETVWRHVAPVAEEEVIVERSRFIDDEAWSGPPSQEWAFGELPNSVQIRRGAHVFRAYPGLLDTGTAARPMLFADQDDAEASTADAVRRLFSLRQQKPLSEQVAWLPGVEELLSDLQRLEPRRELRSEVSDLLAFRALAELPAVPRTAADFETLLSNATERIAMATQEVAKPLSSLLKAWRDTRRQITLMSGQKEPQAVSDVRSQVENLTPAGFLTMTPWERLQHFPRYLRAANQRLKRVAEGGEGQDLQRRQLIHPHAQQLEELLGSDSGEMLTQEVQKYRWMIEEYRVSVFAQQLGTSQKVSPKRLDEQLARCTRSVRT